MQMLISQLVGLVEMLNFALLDKNPARLVSATEGTSPHPEIAIDVSGGLATRN